MVVLYTEKGRFVSRSGRALVEDEGAACYPFTLDQPLVRQFKASHAPDWQGDAAVIVSSQPRCRI